MAELVAHNDLMGVRFLLPRPRTGRLRLVGDSSGLLIRRQGVRLLAGPPIFVVRVAQCRASPRKGGDAGSIPVLIPSSRGGMVYAADLNSAVFGYVGSTPTGSTIYAQPDN